MMKKLIKMTSDHTGRDDDYFYLVFDDQVGELFIEYSWHYWRPRGNEIGEEKWSLAELKRKQPDIYKMAVEMIGTTLFAEGE